MLGKAEFRIQTKWGLHLSAVAAENAQASWSRQGRPDSSRSRQGLVGFLTRESQELHIRNVNPELRLFASIRAFLENLDVVEPPAGGSSWPCRKPRIRL